MKVTLITGIVAATASFTNAKTYIWPSEYDEIEEILSVQGGYLSRRFADGVVPCSEGGNVKGRQNAAEWIRTAFHDMITHDAKQRTGGIDGSIWFETTRPENNALAFNNTFNFMNFLYSSRASAADLLAMSVIVSHSSCGGTTKIPFRYGRIDAYEAGPFGVPEAHTPLQTMLSRFATAGYSQEDMITLVACGHTLGGVHSVDFPQISPGSSNIYNDTVTNFDSSPYQFDNTVATEYVKGTTKSPLVIGTNDTLNSDKRIFGSDKNKTMKALAKKPSAFEAKCAKVFNRMIDTVPKSVKLSSPVVAIEIKPNITKLYLNDEGSLVFAGRVRVRTTQGAKKGRDPADLSVHLTYSDRKGKGATVIQTEHAGDSTGLYGETFAWYEYETIIEPTQGISKFNIHLTVPSTKKTTKYTNEGHGYPVNDAILYQDVESCVSRTSVNGTRAFVAKRQGVIVRKMSVESVDFEATGEVSGRWVFYEAIVQLSTSAWSTTFDIISEAKKKKNGVTGYKEAKIEFLRTRTCARVSS
ncbi:heme peroxidase [Dactylonectria macrodidyma]|uniref:Peroxidase n=1 Tax=Dactylonectria macrodidyma TaxID=307937 RepID=A0A9P9JDL8_9HYPO|nr:heme peroxidase [Dactylonectria macrodidyma]